MGGAVPRLRWRSKREAGAKGGWQHQEMPSSIALPVAHGWMAIGFGLRVGTSPCRAAGPWTTLTGQTRATGGGPGRGGHTAHGDPLHAIDATRDAARPVSVPSQIDPTRPACRSGLVRLALASQQAKFRAD